MRNVIEISGVSKNYGDLKVVKNLSFIAARGTCVGLLGPNGAGKTTTVRMLTAQYPYPSGSIKVFGKEVADFPRETKAVMGIVPQNSNLDADFNVEGTLRTYGMYFGISRKDCMPRIEEQLSFWGLADKRKAKIEELSGGMARRLLIARALLNHPGLLIMDEPTAGLDPQSRRIVWEKIMDLKKKGITILLTTHYMEEAERLCERVVVMSLGEKVADESPKDLIRNTMGEEILETGTEDSAWLSWKKDLDKGLETFDHGSRAYVYCKACLKETLGEIAVRRKLQEFSVRKANLEDVYLKLTGQGLT